MARLRRDERVIRLGVAAEAIRMIPVDDETQSLRAKALAAVEELQERVNRTERNETVDFDRG